MTRAIRLSWIVIGFLIVSTANAQIGEKPSTFLDPEVRETVKSIGARKDVMAALKFIKDTDDRTVTEHIELTEIPAPPFKEEARAAHWLQMIKVETGLDSVWIDAVGNVLAWKKGTTGNRTVVLDAHLDTVFPEGTDVTVKTKGDTLLAPGIGDDTRGLAMVLTVARALHHAKIETKANQLFVASVGEEGLGDLRGVKHLLREGGPQIDSWISIDGGVTGRVNNQALGSYRYKVEFLGEGGHSWGVFGLANPHHAMGSAIHHFVAGADAYTSDGQKTSYNVGVMGGGTSVNSIPFESYILVDIRSEIPSRLDAMENILRKACEKALNAQNEIARLGKPIELKITKIGDRPSGSIDEKAPLIQNAIGVTAFMGKYPKLTVGSTNSNIPISLGIPAVTIGRGGQGRNGHSLHEWWMNDESGPEAIQLALMLFVTECGM